MTRWLLSWTNSDQDFICLLGLWNNLNKTRIEKSRLLSLPGNLAERKKREGRQKKRPARKLIWAEDQLRSIPAGLFDGSPSYCERVGWRSQEKTGFIPFSDYPSLLSSFPLSIPTSPNPSPLPLNLPAPTLSFPLHLHPSIQPRRRHYVLTQLAKGTN